MSPPPELPEPPPLRIQRIERSLACLVWGVLSFVPLLGIVFGAIGIRKYFGSRLGSKGDWNPAARHRAWGGWLALLGLALHILVISGCLLVLASQVTG